MKWTGVSWRRDSFLQLISLSLSCFLWPLLVQLFTKRGNQNILMITHFFLPSPEDSALRQTRHLNFPLQFQTKNGDGSLGEGEGVKREAGERPTAPPAPSCLPQLLHGLSCLSGRRYVFLCTADVLSLLCGAVAQRCYYARQELWFL